MFEHDLFKLNVSVTEALKSVKGLKSLFARLQRYENVAKLRTIEKQLETVEKGLPYYPYPIPNPFLKPGGELYFRELFYYAALNEWDIPEIFSDAFKARKTRLNDSIQFGDQNTKGLLSLNQKLAAVESRPINFFNFLNEMHELNGVRDVLNRFKTGNIVIRCYTSNIKYTVSQANFDYRMPFYLFKLPMTALTDASAVYYHTGKKQNTLFDDFLKPLPLSFRDEEIAYLFFMIASEGLLAWEDLLNVEKVMIDLDVKYRFWSGS